MAMELYLAMTPGEVSGCHPLPKKIAWMACHFSPWSSGLSNLPTQLPEDSVLILDDSTPFREHDAAAIAAQLSQAVEQLRVRRILLDFQRPGVIPVQELAQKLAATLPCSMAVSAPYAQNLSCAVFLPPLPLNLSLEEQLAPYSGREIWLDIAPTCGELRIQTKGNAYIPMAADVFPRGRFHSDILHCRYTASITEDGVIFSLSRHWEELERLLDAAEKLGVTTALGLYQELSAYI